MSEFERDMASLRTEDLLVDETAREAFKAARHGIRRDLSAFPFVRLDNLASAPDAVHPRRRRSERLFSSRPVAFADMSSFLAALSPEETADGLLYRYASAGGAYAVQVYLQAQPSRIEGLPAGLYYHHPLERRLVLLSDAAIEDSDHFSANRPWIARAAFTLLLVADLGAITPLYGAKARDFCLVESGEIVQLLQGAASSLPIGLCQAGVVDLARVRAALDLGAHREVVAVLVGGSVERSRSTRRPEPQPPANAERPLPASSPVPPIQASAAASTSSLRSDRCRAIEAELTGLWKASLGTDIEPTALFFDVGATSIMAARVVRQIQERYPSAEIEVADVFAYPCIRDLAARVDERLGPGAASAGEPPPREPERTIDAAAAPLPTAEPDVQRPTAPPPVQPARSGDPEPVAIVGIAVRVAGASTLDAFWDLLVEGRCAVGAQPAARRALVPAFEPTDQQTFTGSYLADVELFDPLLFHMSAREAERVDPAQRLMLEVTADLLASSGYGGGQLSGSRTGVFIGASSGAYVGLRDDDPDMSRLLAGNMTAIIANRISHVFDLSGPSLVVDTACSSSLVAVDQAVRAIQSGDIDAAIVGGVNLILSPGGFHAFRADGMESPSGLCRTFDAAADGFVRGEGVIAVLLRRQSAAISDRDHIFAVIRGSATNHDGRTNSLPVPSPGAQRNVIRLAQARAGVTPDAIDYVEAHGTGTKLGDPIEVRGLDEAFRTEATIRGVVGVGSIKSNLGHLEFAAGIAGLAKVALALERGVVPPTLHLQEPNPHIDFASTPFYIADRARPWPARGRPRRAAVSSFGVGGANAHVILEEGPPRPPRAATENPPVTLVALSAPDEATLADALKTLVDHVERHSEIPIEDLAYTLAAGRPQLPARAAFVVSDRDQLIDRVSLAVVAPERRRPGVFIGGVDAEPRLDGRDRDRIAASVAELPDIARRTLRRCTPDERLDPLLGPPIGEDIAPPASLGRAGWATLLSIAGELWVRGFAFDLPALDGAAVRHRELAPGLSLRRERCWWPVAAPPTRRAEMPRPHAAASRGGIEAALPAPRDAATTPASDLAASTPISDLDDMAALVRQHVASTLRFSVDRVDPRQPLSEMGFDSLAATELMTALGEATGLEVDANFFFEHPTVEKLAQALVARGARRVLAPQPSAAREHAAAPAIATDRSVAVIGMAGRLPGAADLDELWSNLAAGRDAITEVPPSRFDIEAIFNPDRTSTHGSYGRWGGFLDGINRFDARFFRIADREARSMDPQHRLLLTTVWQAVEDAGLGRRISGSRTGVYVGASYTHHRDQMAQEGVRLADAHTGLDNSNAILANRISYFLDLRGPCLTIDTLCSSSLVALHAAMQALRSGEIEYAIVAGVHAALSPPYYEAVSRLGALSPDGRCRTFDAGANGYVPGEGVVVLVLAPLLRAVNDGEQVHAVIRGTAVNHGGQAAGLTVPNPAAQADVVRAALADAAVSASRISYIETHGTGTSLGDPVEIGGLEMVLSADMSRRQFCGVGSLKSNIGHLEPAAGLASVAKVILAMKHRTLPPTLHMLEPNRAIAFEQGPCYVVDRLRPWRADAPRCAGVSSFGLGGTNAHVIVEEAPVPRAPDTRAELPSLFVVSAKDGRGLRAYVERCHEFIRRRAHAYALADVCFAATEGRAHFAHRVAMVADSMSSLERQLAEVSDALQAERPAPVPSGSSRAHHLAAEFLAGRSIDSAPLFAGARKVSLPTYPFDERELATRPMRAAKELAAAPKPAEARAPVADEHPLREHLRPVDGNGSGSTTYLLHLDLGGDA